MMISLRARSDFLHYLSPASDFNDGFVDESVFLEVFDVFSGNIIVFFQLLKKFFVFLLCFLQHLRFFCAELDSKIELPKGLSLLLCPLCDLECDLSLPKCIERSSVRKSSQDSGD